MRWDELAVFLAVAEEGSFSRAASRLGLPKSRVSRNVAQLEESLRDELFYRTTRRVTLTAAGRRLHDRVAPLYREIDRAALPIRPEGVVTGTLRVTTTPQIGQALLAPLVAAYTRQCPDVRVEASLTNDLLDLADGDLDVALRVSVGPRLPDTPHVTARRIGTIGSGWFAAPRYLGARGTPTTREALDAHDRIAFSYAAQDFPTPPRITADDVGFARAACVAGGGLASLPLFLVEEHVATGELVRVLPDDTSWVGAVWLVVPHGRGDLPRVTVFRELLFETLATSAVLGPPGVALGPPAR